jgi:hypothetical protein
VVWSDWSSFKIEAYDATRLQRPPASRRRGAHVAALRQQPDREPDELGSREDAAHRDGEQDALALVTINTARMLGIDDRVGSLEPERMPTS